MPAWLIEHCLYPGGFAIYSKYSALVPHYSEGAGCGVRRVLRFRAQLTGESYYSAS